jgi:hypothetical protein
MNKFIKVLDKCVYKFWMIFCGILFGGALFIKAVYHPDDFPYFKLNTAVDIAILVGIILFYIVLFKYAQLIENKVKYWMIFGVFLIIAVAFIFLVPITMFSDMEQVANGAIMLAQRDYEGILASGYLQVIVKNLKVALFYSLFDFFFPKNILTLRCINIVFYLFTVLFIAKTAKQLGFKYPKVMMIILASSVSLILYCNHIYFDYPVLFLCSVGMYFYTKEKNIRNILLTGIFLGLAATLRVLAFLFFIAVLMDVIFRLFKEKIRINKVICLIILLIAAVGIPKGADTVINKQLRSEGTATESMWTLFWMGINEEEFGMMHNEILDSPKTFEDFYELLISRNVKQNVKLFGRKIFWTWTQGTYQAQRYGFGLDEDDYSEKFMYETPVTKYLMKDEQVTRKVINSVCRAQYMAMFMLMIVGLGKLTDEDREKYRLFVYLMFGTFLILIFYEMKSRYVLHCIIPMSILAMRGLERVSEKIEMGKFKKVKNI